MKRNFNSAFKLTPKGKQQMNRRFYCCAVLISAIGVLLFLNTFCQPWLLNQIHNINYYNTGIIALLTGCYLLLTDSLILAFKLKKQQLDQVDRD